MNRIIITFADVKVNRMYWYLLFIILYFNTAIIALTYPFTSELYINCYNKRGLETLIK